MNQCKNCIFSERKNGEFVYCKNFEKNVHAKSKCSRYIIDMAIQDYDNINIKK